MPEKINPLKIGDLTARIPIIQGGMGVGISLSSLASAVANEGGIGVIASAAIGMLEKDFAKNYKQANLRALKKEIRKAKELTKGILGVNIMVALSDFYQLLITAIKEKIDIIFIGAGLPLKMPPEIFSQQVKTKIAPIVSSARAVNTIFKYWSRKYNHVPDAVIVEGPLAGGHLGYKLNQINDDNYKLENTVPKVIETLKPYEKEFKKEIPVIAAGGIYTGKDIYKFLQLGAKGVQMGTRFVTTYECDADIKFKQAYIKSKKEDIIIIKSPVGLPGRAIKNKFLQEVEKGIRKPFKCPWQCLKNCDFKKAPYCISLALTNAKKGNFNYGFAFAGANAYKADKIVSVKELIKNLLEQYLKEANNG